MATFLRWENLSNIDALCSENSIVPTCPTPGARGFTGFRSLLTEDSLTDVKGNGLHAPESKILQGEY